MRNDGAAFGEPGAPIDLADLYPRRHARTLVKLLLDHPEWKVGAEIGVAQGRTTLLVLDECPHLTLLLAVEPFQYIEDSIKSGLYQDFDFAHNRRCVEAVKAKHPQRMTIIDKTSVEAAAGVIDGNLDFVFIDANHQYAEVVDDLTAWVPKVRAGGGILGHDYSGRWPGVVRAVDERFGRDNVQVYSDSIWLVPN